jgi:predicted dehydrogenase
VAIDYATRRASISSLAPPAADGAWPGVQVRNLDVLDVEPLRAEIKAFVTAAAAGEASPVSAAAGRQALALALRVLERIHEHAGNTQVEAVKAQLSGRA